MTPIRGVLLGALLMAVSGCNQMLDAGCTCDPCDADHIGPNGDPDPCHYQDPKCTGECIPKAPVGWFGPDLLWMGPGAEMPMCPEHAPGEGFKGHADPTGVPPDCPACTCEGPIGKCVLPEQIDVFNAKKCPGVPVMSFDAPSGWDGSCTMKDAIPKGQLCNGVPCVQSIQIEPPRIEASCTPANLPPPTPARTPPFEEGSDWAVFALACVGSVVAGCPNEGDVCVPAAPPPPPGFHQCISQLGEAGACTLEYPHRHVFYQESIDSRTCTPCECSEPVGGVCTVKFTTYEGPQCGPPSLDIPVFSDQGVKCIDMLGSTLSGKTAKVESVDLGACVASGGEPTGEITATQAMTFCCQ